MKQSEDQTPAREQANRSLVEKLAAKYEIQPEAFLGSLRDTVFSPGKDRKGHPNPPFTNEELCAALVISAQYDLNPFTREIYVTRSKGRLLVIVPVDGWIKCLNRAELFEGIDFEFEGEVKDKSLVCWCTIYLKGRATPVRVPEYLDECWMDKDTWKKWPRRMLRHKALIQCARIAIGLTGIMDEDEAERLGARVPEYRVGNRELPAAEETAPTITRRTVPREITVKKRKAKKKPAEPSPQRTDWPELQRAQTAAEQTSIPMEGEPETPTENQVSSKPLATAADYVNEIGAISKTSGFTRDEWAEVNGAAGADVITVDISIELLEAALQKAEAISAGKRE